MLSTNEHVGRTTKTERYGWQTVDKPGQFQTIKKHELHVDHSYQRQALDEKVLRLAREWSWVACGSLIVAYRVEAGTFHVIDGQYRVMAARRRAEIEKLPCMVFHIPSVTDEALAFLRANCNRKPVTAFEKFNAHTVTKDPGALLVKKLAEQAGRTLQTHSTDAKSLTCVRLMVDLANRSPEVLERLWPLIVDLSEGGPMYERVIAALAYIEARLPDGVSLASGKLAKRLVQIGNRELLNGAIEAAAYFKKGGARVYAEGVLNRLNKGLRNRVELNAAAAAEE